MKIKENKKAPLFKLSGTRNTKFDLKRIKGKLVVYFYPKDDTPGCTLETKDFSKFYKKFKKKYKVPFELLSDPHVKSQKKYSVWGMKSFMGKKFLGTIRTTIFIDKGKVKKIWSNVRVKNHAKEVFNFVSSYK